MTREAFIQEMFLKFMNYREGMAFVNGEFEPDKVEKTIKGFVDVYDRLCQNRKSEIDEVENDVPTDREDLKKELFERYGERPWLMYIVEEDIISKEDLKNIYSVSHTKYSGGFIKFWEMFKDTDAITIKPQVVKQAFSSWDMKLQSYVKKFREQPIGHYGIDKKKACQIILKSGCRDRFLPEILMKL